MKNAFEKYLDYLSINNPYLSHAVKETSEKVINKFLHNFNWGNSQKIGLLLGHIQSGKTSHVLGIISRATAEGFNFFLLITSDNTYLQSQTYKRALESLEDLNVCDEKDDVRFFAWAGRKPTVLVLKKNARILRTWLRRLSNSKLFPGNPIFIIDDEADAASLNTKINDDEISTINSLLRQIKDLSGSNVYLQLTATPQALFLQTQFSQWKPEFIETFSPGKQYIGGNFFFSDDIVPPHTIITDDLELPDLLNDDEYSANGLMRALISYLITCSHFSVIYNFNVCNFVIHPSLRINEHEIIARKIGEYLNHLNIYFDDPDNYDLIREVYENLKSTKSDIIEFEKSILFIKDALSDNIFNIKIINSRSVTQEYSDGMNIIIGGNSLGRGITFPKLQTMYYCRTSRIPQIDTVWQHCRMFGYDRDQDLIRVFIPPRLYRSLNEINNVNNSIFSQASKNSIENLKIYCSSNLRPTRSNVVDQSNLTIIAGGVNYFPFVPYNDTILDLDKILNPYQDTEYYEINYNIMINILQKINNEFSEEWSNSVFINCIKAYFANQPSEQGIMIVRRERDIAKGTGTLLSPNDRQLSQSFHERIVLTLYKVTGQKGWEGQKLWIPNIKFPDIINFYDIRG